MNRPLRLLFLAISTTFAALMMDVSNARGQIYVTSNVATPPGGGTIDEYSTSGQTIQSPAVLGLYDPLGLALSGNNLFVTSYQDGTVNEATLGSPLSSTLITGLQNPFGIAASAGNLFVVNNGSGTIGKYTMSGATVNSSLISGLNGPTAIAIFEGGSVQTDKMFVANAGNNTIGVYNTFGATETNALNISGLDSPTGLAIDSSGNIVNLYVANSNNGTIGLYTILLNPLSTIPLVLQSQPSFISGLTDVHDVAVFNGDLFVTYGNSVGEWMVNGTVVNPTLVSDSSGPQAIVVVPETSTWVVAALVSVSLLLIVFRRRSVKMPRP